jgi:hypothetical protein
MLQDMPGQSSGIFATARPRVAWMAGVAHFEVRFAPVCLGCDRMAHAKWVRSVK